jgi:hypothetical protein
MEDIPMVSGVKLDVNTEIMWFGVHRGTMSVISVSYFGNFQIFQSIINIKKN